MKVTRDRLLGKDLMHVHDIKDIKGVDNDMGVTVNGSMFGGSKTYIASNERLNVPLLYEYNTHKLTVVGNVDITGTINIM